MMMDRTVKITIIPVDENESFFDSELDVGLFRVVGVVFPCGSVVGGSVSFPCEAA